MPAPFHFRLGESVRIKTTDEFGLIMARAEHVLRQLQYLVRSEDASGGITNDWYPQGDLESTDDAGGGKPQAAPAAGREQGASLAADLSALETAAQQAAHARLAGQALLAELEMAHRLIALLVLELPIKVPERFADTRHKERATALALARNSTLAMHGGRHA